MSGEISVNRDIGKHAGEEHPDRAAHAMDAKDVQRVVVAQTVLELGAEIADGACERSDEESARLIDVSASRSDGDKAILPERGHPRVGPASDLATSYPCKNTIPVEKFILATIRIVFPISSTRPSP